MIICIVTSAYRWRSQAGFREASFHMRAGGDVEMTLSSVSALWSWLLLS